MRKRLSDLARVEHIAEAIQQIDLFMAGVDYNGWQQDLKLRLAVSRLIEIIGEACNHMLDETKLQFPDVEWPVLYGIRNVIVHQYFGIDYDIIWQVVQRDLPILREHINDMLRQLRAFHS